ncbi:hypothetical protein DFH07DRAFT_1055119 [Mycena maculata]|uniref:Uncharacterized protein n=1 Tax=Mycena maculata TaxID=230809 RepID=A0AAD7KB80_9AGAR|nr:hypothetical protein DFH07DRAFT_1055119 [Mycena maculata]
MILTALRAASTHCRLTLNAVHNLNSRKHDGPTRKSRFPDDVDVVLASHLVFTLSGVLNGTKVDSSDVLKSQLAQHLVDYFQANAAELGIGPVSSMYLGDDGLPNLKIVSSRCLTPESELCCVHAALVRIDLNYVWHTSNSSTSLIHPFSTHLALPFQILLDNVVSRFFTWHLVRRYPLIFGPWCQQLDVERPYFDKIFRSISNMIARSPNPSFRKKCTRMFRTMQEQHAANITSAASSLATYFGADSESDEDRDETALTDQEAFSLSMEIRYRTCMRRPQFKGSTGAMRADDASDDDELSQDLSLLTPDSSQRFDENFLWQGAPVSTTFDDALDDVDLRSGLVSSVANIDRRCPAVDMGMEIEYQVPSEVWSDIDIDSNEDGDLLCLSSDDEVPDIDPLDAGFSLVTPGSDPNRPHTRDLRLAWDVKMDGSLSASHAAGSPDAPPLRLRPSTLSPPAGTPARQGTPAWARFPGLSDSLDLELSFDSDSASRDSDDHALEEFAELPDTCPDPELELEYRVGNGSDCT